MMSSSPSADHEEKQVLGDEIGRFDIKGLSELKKEYAARQET
jgi:hypothetical protein